MTTLIFHRPVLRVAFLLSAVLFATSCMDNITSEVQPLPSNPYDTLDYSENTIPEFPIDSTTFLGIHKYILTTKCAQPACHDGSFEPDYRTVMSAYNTLVYAPVVKNDPLNSFAYRVVPGDTALSWLHERITTNDAILGRMPLYDSLPQRQIDMIAHWIKDGAKDIFGNTYPEPNTQPTFYGVVAYLTAGNIRIDTVRGGFFLNPFMAPANSEMKLWFGILDDDVIPTLLASPKVRFSTNPDDFDSAPGYNLAFQFTPFPSYSIFGSPADYYLSYTINTSQFNSGDVVYLRVYAKDPSHANYTEIPSDTAPFYFKTYFAFVVQ